MQAVIPSHNDLNNLELLARQTVEGFIIGLHKSPFHGFSVEFAEHRNYNQGDNLKYVDWKVYGRSDKMFVKKFEEETNLRCCIAIDTSSSMYFPETGINKLQYACVGAASLALLIKGQMDATALALFNTELHMLTKAKTGSRHYRECLTVLQNLIHSKAERQTTNIAHALHQLAEQLHRRSLVVVFSDFSGNENDLSELFSALHHLRYNKHEVLLFHLWEKELEENLNFDNRPYEFEDLETGNVIKLNPADIQLQYKEQRKKYESSLQTHCFAHRIDLVKCDLTQSPTELLRQYLVKRNKLM